MSERFPAAGEEEAGWDADALSQASRFRYGLYEIARTQKETAGGIDALSLMGLLIGFTAFAVVLGFGAGYAVRKRRMRRSYYHDD